MEEEECEISLYPINNELGRCEHLNEITNYCEECRIFMCEECSMEHIEHIQNVNSWDNEINEYLLKCKDTKSRAKILQQSSASYDEYKGEIFSSIDCCFQSLFTKLNTFREQLKSNIWTQFSGTRSSTTVTDIKKVIGELEEMISKISLSLDKQEKSPIFEILQSNKLPGLQAQIRDLKVETNTVSERENQIKQYIQEFKVSERFNYSHLFTFMDLEPKDLFWTLCPWGITSRGVQTDMYRSSENRLYMENSPKHMSDNMQYMGQREFQRRPEECLKENNIAPDMECIFPNGRQSWERNEGISSIGHKSMCATTPLPPYFRLTITKGKGSQVLFGVTQTQFKTKQSYIGFQEGEWVCSSDGTLSWVEEEGGRTLKTGNPPWTDQYAVISYTRDGNLAFYYNNSPQPVHFYIGIGKILYFCASLCAQSSSIQIVNVLSQ